MKLKEIEQHNKKIMNAITKCGNTIIELKMKEIKLKREIKEPCKFCKRIGSPVVDDFRICMECEENYYRNFVKEN